MSRVPQVSFQFQIRIVFFGAAARTGSDDDENVASSSLKPTEWTGYWRSIHEIDRNQQFARFSRSQPAKHVPPEMTILCVRQFFCLRFSLYRLLPDRHTHRCWFFVSNEDWNMYDQGDRFSLRGYDDSSKASTYIRCLILNQFSWIYFFENSCFNDHYLNNNYLIIRNAKNYSYDKFLTFFDRNWTGSVRFETW